MSCLSDKHMYIYTNFSQKHVYGLPFKRTYKRTSIRKRETYLSSKSKLQMKLHICFTKRELNNSFLFQIHITIWLIVHNTCKHFNKPCKGVFFFALLEHFHPFTEHEKSSTLHYQREQDII